MIHNPRLTKMIRTPQLTYPWLVLIVLVLSTGACMLSSPESLNDGKGTRENPVPPRTYAHTTDEYDVRALNVVWEQENGDQENTSEEVRLRVQFQIHCTEDANKVCNIEDIKPNIKLADASGILYEPIFPSSIKDPLGGEVLGDGEKAGWLEYRIPRGVEIIAAVAKYGQEQYVFFQLP